MVIKFKINEINIIFFYTKILDIKNYYKQLKNIFQVIIIFIKGMMKFIFKFSKFLC
jgi:hypothetical protein